MLQRQRRILHNRAVLDRELTPRVLRLTLEALLLGEPRRVGPVTGRAGHAIGPTLLDRKCQTIDRVGKELDGGLKSGGVGDGVHERIMADGSGLVKYIITLE